MPFLSRASTRVFLYLAFAPALSLSPGCKTDATDSAATAKPCCDQPPIPDGVTPFKVIAEEATGPANGPQLTLKARLETHASRDAIYPVLHTLYRHAALNRSPEPVAIAVYLEDPNGQTIASMARPRGQAGPACTNDVPHSLSERVEQVLLHTQGRLPERNAKDSCHLGDTKTRTKVGDEHTLVPTVRADEPSASAVVTYPYTKMGEDVYVETLSFNAAMAGFVELATTLFEDVEDLQSLRFEGRHEDETVLAIDLTRPQFKTAFGGVAEDIAAHSAVIFQKLTTGRLNERTAEREQESWKAKAYRQALAALPKTQVDVARSLGR